MMRDVRRPIYSKQCTQQHTLLLIERMIESAIDRSIVLLETDWLFAHKNVNWCDDGYSHKTQKPRKIILRTK